MKFTLFLRNLSPFGVGGHEIYNFLSSYRTDGTYTKSSRGWPSCSGEEDFNVRNTSNNGRRTQTHSNRSPD